LVAPDVDGRAVFGAEQIRPGLKGHHDTVDQQTKAALKQDKFVSTTTHGLEWASENRQSVITTVSILVAVILIAVIGGVIYNSRSDSAAAAFGTAMQEYQTPVAQAGEQVPPGVKTFPSSAARAKAANALFVGVADKYGMTPSGENARYFAGLTYMESGQNQAAEDTLKKVAGSWNSNIAALAKFALAQLYRNTGRDPQAIDLYNQLAAKPTSTVPYGLAKLQLADLYQSEGKTKEAKDIFADLKDKDAKGPAGMIAAEKLNPAPAAPRTGLSQ
jgi:tetratricopeptide (TPR) repeat protein